MKLILLFTVLLLPASTLSIASYQFTFPDTVNSAYVELNGTIDNPLEAYTLCHWTKVEGSISWGTIFSYNTAEQYRALGTWLRSDGVFQTDQNAAVLISKQSDKNISSWLHTCVTANTGQRSWTVYLDGHKKWSGENSEEAQPIPANGRVILGQTNLVTNEFLPNHNFKGQITGLYLWDRVLSPEEITGVYECNIKQYANVINWNIDAWKPSDGVLVSAVEVPCKAIPPVSSTPCPVVDCADCYIF